MTCQLPDFDEEIDGIESYFDKVRSAIDGLNRWRIERNLTLGHFAFGRLAMYEDLSPDNWHEPPVDHPLLDGLLRGSEAESTGDLHFASDYDLDDEIIENAAPILINDADGSQHSAIVDVMNGKNLVIEGPPGTGKSQTITNIIANALYAGQTVLFLADKLAALEVVKDRLDAAGLGDFCLELHSDKAHPKPIIESLKQRYDLAQYAGDEPNWREELQHLRNARGRVRDYLSALHGRDDHEARTPFDLMWATIAARRELAKEFDAVRRLNLEGILSKSWHEIEREKDTLKLYAQVVQDYSERHGPFANAVWSKAGFAELSDDDPDTVADNIRDAYEGGRALSELLAATSSTIELDLPRSPKTIKAWVDSIFCLPAIEEDYLLPQLSALSLLDIEAAAKLATERMELVARPIAQLPSDKFEAVGQFASQLEHTEFMDVSPAAIVVRTKDMLGWQQSLIESLNVFSQLIVALPSKPSTSRLDDYSLDQDEPRKP